LFVLFSRGLSLAVRCGNGAVFVGFSGVIAFLMAGAAMAADGPPEPRDEARTLLEGWLGRGTHTSFLASGR